MAGSVPYTILNKFHLILKVATVMKCSISVGIELYTYMQFSTINMLVDQHLHGLLANVCTQGPF